MPHVIIECSNNLTYKFADIVATAHGVMGESGLFGVPDIKTRLYVTEHFLVGEKGGDGSFVHIIIYLLEGRSLQQKQDLTENMLKSLKMLIKDVNSISVDIRDLKRDTYKKFINN